MNPEFWGVSQVGWQAISSLTAVVAFLIAAGAAVAAWKQYQLNRQTRIDQTRPYVIVDFQSSPASLNMMDLVVRNIGTTPAYDVTVRLSPRPTRARETPNFEVAKARLLDGTIPMFAPGRELRMFFDNMVERKDADLPMSFECSATYKDSQRRVLSETSIVAMDVGLGMLQADVLGVHHIAKSLRQIQQDIHGSPLRKGPIYVISEERSEHQERRREQAKEDVRAHEEFMKQVRYVSDDEDDPPSETPQQAT